MIQLYSWKTPNGRKASIMLEETGLPYTLHPVDLGAGEQMRPEFLAISPNNKIPAIVDDDSGLTLFESGAVLAYLAEKSGMLLPSWPDRWTAIQWIYWSVGGLGPMLGQLGYYAVHGDEKIPAAIDRFRTEAVRLLGVLERRLGVSRHIGGNDYSIADIVSFPWIAEARNVMREPLGDIFAASPAIEDWYARLGERAAVVRGMALLDGRI